jgi:SAM-dependent methyltransferase
LHIIKNEIRGEKKYGIQTTGADELKHLAKRGIDIAHATIYMPASYDLLEKIFDNLNGTNPEHLLDLGSGKGRIMAVAATHGIRKLTGLDISKKLCDAARNNMQKITARIPGLKYKIYNNDAFYFQIPDDVDCIIMFNPFDGVIMSGVILNINESLERKPRPLKIIYINPQEKQLFTEDNWREIFHTKTLGYLEASILIKN